MPANLTAEAKAKWKEAQATKAPEERIRLLREFLSLMPKHKGTENLRDQTKRKIAALKAELAAKSQKRSGIGASLLTVERTGDAQIAVIGPTNAGKSSLLGASTNAKPHVASYPFTTQQLEPGMLMFEDLQLQLVEVPALINEGEAYVVRSLYADFVRGADAIIVVLDASIDPVTDSRKAVRGLERLAITYTRPEASVQLVKNVKGGVNQVVVSGELADCTVDEVLRLLNEYRLKNVLVRVFGRVKIDDVEEAVLENVAVYKPVLIFANKVDLSGGAENARELVKYLPENVPLVSGSCLTRFGISEVPRVLFKVLEIIRVYTRDPNDPRPSPKPFVVKTGTTTGALAKMIHSQLYEGYRFARIWGKSGKFPGERVGPAHVLHDGDVVEIHA